MRGRLTRENIKKPRRASVRKADLEATGSGTASRRMMRMRSVIAAL